LSVNTSFDAPQPENPVAFFFGFSRWKSFITHWLPGHTIHRAGRYLLPLTFPLYWKKRILATANPRVYVWGMKFPWQVKEFCNQHAIPFFYVEDGFIRSVKLGAQKVPPASLTIDGRAPYFDATRPSDLEVLLQTHDFDSDAALMQRAEKAMFLLLAQRLSKYNLAAVTSVEKIYGPKTRKRVLVVGQVENDASITYGCATKMDNNMLVRMAAEENPDAQIIYKPHPEILHGTRNSQSNPKDVAGLCLILGEDIPMADALETIDHVYTITSLAGFEAMLRAIQVTCVGCPFYAGWGLTDDRQPNPRRTRTLTVAQLFAGAYLLYPHYLNPETGEKAEFEDVVEVLARQRASMMG
jgi:capsular polysaccharide export protein